MKRQQVIKYLKNTKRWLFSVYHTPINQVIEILEMLEKKKARIEK
jgi:hypothetical protein